MKPINSIYALVILAIFVFNEGLSGQTIMQNPTACFGRDCNPNARIDAHSHFSNDCFEVDDQTISYKLNRDECNDFSSLAHIGVDFGNIDLSDSNSYHKFALYSLNEIQNTVAAFGAEVRMHLSYSGSYEACPTGVFWEGRTYAGHNIDCGKNRAVFGFVATRTPDRFQGTFLSNNWTYIDFDLSKCTEPLTISFSSIEICKLDVNMLQLVFEQK